MDIPPVNSRGQPPRGANIAQKLTDLEARVRRLEEFLMEEREEAPNDDESEQEDLPF